MMMTPEQSALTAQEPFDALSEFVRRAAEAGLRIDTVERELFRQLLGLGHSLMSAFVAGQGDGIVGPQAETTEGTSPAGFPSVMTAATSRSSAG